MPLANPSSATRAWLPDTSHRLRRARSWISRDSVTEFLSGRPHGRTKHDGRQGTMATTRAFLVASAARSGRDAPAGASYARASLISVRLTFSRTMDALSQLGAALTDRYSIER